jgi:hypothetical protein
MVMYEGSLCVQVSFSYSQQATSDDELTVMLQ